MKNILLILVAFSVAQVSRYEVPTLLSKDIQFHPNLNNNIISKEYTNINLVEAGTHYIIEDRLIIFYPIYLNNEKLYTCNISTVSSIENAKLFLIDQDSDAFIGPLFFYENKINERIFSQNFIIEISIPIQNIDDLEIILHSIKDYHAEADHKKQPMPYTSYQQNRENPVILVTGFWPPTNEMIRHFSQSVELNPSGWIGEDWEERGYDIISYFPEFTNPDCSNCGMGYGDFEVDYQDTSDDFWPIFNGLSPIAIITFSRGYIDQSWEMEYNFYNRTNWYPDYQTPTLPTPNPPDEEVESFFQRNSTLPMENIMNTINESTLGLDAYIDWDGDPGHFVSEFMGYHGVWYHDINLETCLIAGHIHVGGTIDWDTAKDATEISIREIIDYLDQFIYTPGDINADNVIDILDLVYVVNVILGQTELSNIQTYAADMNLDGTINIQDIILIINLILS